MLSFARKACVYLLMMSVRFWPHLLCRYKYLTVRSQYKMPAGCLWMSIAWTVK